MLRLFILIITLCCAGIVHAAAPQVVTSITPLYHLASAVMEGVGTPTLLIPPNVSEHTYALKPSQMSAIQSADLVVWVGPGLETSLTKTLRALAPAHQICLLDDRLVSRYPLRESQTPSAPHTHPDQNLGIDHIHIDPHLWLDPLNAIQIAELIEKRLITHDPAHAAQYRENLATVVAALSSLNDTLTQALAPLQGKSFLVFHDAFQYFEQRYGLTLAAAVTEHPDLPLSPKRVADLRQLVAQKHIACLITEPSSLRSAQQVSADLKLRLVVASTQGVASPAGLAGYENLLLNIADAFKACAPD